jgi:RNA polymerase sigma-70 factor (ECF subfamily)
VGNPEDAVDDFENWYERVHPRVVTSMLLLAGDLDLARDVVDEAFCRAFERWSRVARMASPEGWVYVVAVHELQRRRVRRRKEQAVMRSGVHAELLSVVASDFEALIDRLPPRQRTAVVLRHVSDLTESDIALAMNVTRSTVSNTLRDAYRNLRETLNATERERPDACTH